MNDAALRRLVERRDQQWREQAYRLAEAAGTEISLGGFVLALVTRMEAFREAPHLLAEAEAGAETPLVEQRVERMQKDVDHLYQWANLRADESGVMRPERETADA